MAKTLWAKIPLVYREQATFHTDQYDVYKGVIPAEQHRAITKKARKTNHIERFNNTLGSACLVWYVRHSPSPKNWRITSGLSSISSATTISREEQHYLCSTTHYTTIYKVFAKWADDGSLWQAFVASVRHLVVSL